LTDKQIEKNRRFNDSLKKTEGLNVLPPPLAPIYNWFFDNMHKIYSDNQEGINEALEGQSYICTIPTNEGFKSTTPIE
jgi:hypothetical protein